MDAIAALRNIRLQSSGVSNKVRCVTGWRWSPLVPLPDYDLWYVCEGSGEIRLADATYPLKPGTCMLVRPGSLPLAVQDEKHPLMVVFVHFTAEAGPGETFVPPPECSCIADLFAFEGLLHHLLEADRGTRLWKADEFDYLMKLILIYLHHAEYERQTKRPALTPKQTDAMRGVVEYIQRESPRIGYADVYEHAGLSPRYLNGLFKQFTGQSLKRYMNNAKMQKAQHLLTESSLSVTEISELMGYSDIYSFSKTFKQHFGMSPTSYTQNRTKITPNGERLARLDKSGAIESEHETGPIAP